MSKRIKEIFLFGLAGVVGYFVDVAVTILLEPIMGVYIARVPGFMAAVTATWLLNRSLTFKSRPSKYKKIYKEYLHYITLMIGGLAMNYAAYAVSVTLLPDSFYKIYMAVAIGSLAGMMINYLTSRKYIYNQD